MPIEEVNDFFGDFAEEVLYTNPAGVEKVIQAIFDTAYTPSTLITDQVANYGPKLTCKTLDVNDADHSATFTIRGEDFHTHTIQPDGTGVTVIYVTRDESGS